MSVLVIAEHDNSKLKTFTLNAINASSKIDADVHVLVAGNKCENVCKEVSAIPLVKKVLQSDSENYENYLAENLTPLIVKLADKYTHITASANTFGKNFMPRDAFATIKSNDKKKCITIRPTSFDPAPTSGGSAPIEKIESADVLNISKFIKKEETKSERPELGTARVVISGGRGMQSGENFKLITAIADKLNAAVGASRAAVDAGYISNDHQVGQTGKVVVPDLYIAVGISGAIQHLAGMKESKIIVAINKDGEAPIFSIADYGLEADLFEALPQFLEELNKLNTIQK